MAAWQNFFIAEVGASAALAGLLFVGVSLNLTRILSMARLPGRAFSALLVLLGILVIASLMLVPEETVTTTGVEVLGVGLILWVLITRIDIRIIRATDRQYRRQAMSNVLISQLATLPYLIGAGILLTGSINGLYWLVPAVIFSFIKAVLDAWVLLVEINR